MRMYKNIFIGTFFTFVVVFIIYTALRESKEEELLQDYKTTTAIITKMSQSVYKSPASGDFKYYVDGRMYKFSQPGDYYKYMSIGDTVLIKYAIKDHNVARVIDKYYMQKYLYLKE